MLEGSIDKNVLEQEMCVTKVVKKSWTLMCYIQYTFSVSVTVIKQRELMHQTC
jgi:hypothetical protein